MLADVCKACRRQQPAVNVNINGHNYNKEYYLVDDTYSQWTTLVKIISNPVGEKRRFAQEQESARKDVERAFGVFAISMGHRSVSC